MPGDSRLEIPHEASYDVGVYRPAAIRALVVVVLNEAVHDVLEVSRTPQCSPLGGEGTCAMSVRFGAEPVEGRHAPASGGRLAWCRSVLRVTRRIFVKSLGFSLDC